LVPSDDLALEELQSRCSAISPCLAWVEALVRSHADDAALVQQGWFFLRRVTWAEEEAALEAVLPALPSFLPALVAHVGVPEVAEHAMRTLAVLSYMDDVVGVLGGCSWRVH
jgi:hypothetical protein